VELVADARLVRGEEVVVGTEQPDRQGGSSLAVLEGGGFVAVWRDEFEPTGYWNNTPPATIMVRIHDANGRPTGVELRADDGPGAVTRGSPVVASLKSGGFVVSWTETTATPGTLDARAQIFDSTGAKVGGEFGVASIAGSITFDQLDESSDSNAAAGLTGGGFVILSAHRPEGVADAYRATVFGAQGQKIAEIPVTSGGNINKADVTALPDGGFLIVWTAAGAGGSWVRLQKFNATGLAVGGEIVVSDAAADHQEAAVTARPDGSFAVIWSDTRYIDGTISTDVRVQLFDAASAQTGPDRVISDSYHFAYSPDIAVTADGGFIATWAGSPRQYSSDIRAMLLDSAAAPVGKAFIVSQVISDWHTDLEAIVLPSGVAFLGWSAPEWVDTGNARLRALLPVTSGGPDSEALTGDAGRNAIHGRDGADQIIGGAEGDALFGGAGDDILDGGDGDDFLDGGHGEPIVGGLGPDQDVASGSGNDSLSGGAGDDVLRTSGAGTDTASGGSGTDLLVVRYGDVATNLVASALTLSPDGGYGGSIGTTDRSVAFSSIERFNITTGAGNDVIRTGNGNDVVASGAGDDFVDVGSGIDRADGGAGIDGISADLSALTMPIPWNLSTAFVRTVGGVTLSFMSFEYFGILKTGSGNDVITTLGLARDEQIHTGGGDDVVLVRNGADQVDGGSGFDLLDVDYRSAVGNIVTSALSGSFAAGYGGSTTAGDRSVAFSGIERFRMLGGSGNDELRGGDGNDSLDGGAGNDRLDAGGGSDTLRGRDGNDIFFYGDSLTWDDDNDGGTGTDTLVLQGNYPNLALGDSSLVGIEGLSLQSGSISRWGQSGTNSYDYSVTTAQASVAAGQQLRVNAQSLLPGEDFGFDGSAETDGGRFLVYAGFGIDLLTGGSGNDIFFFEAGRLGSGDRIAGGAGNDAVVISGAPTGTTGPVQLTIGAGTLTSIESLSFNGRFASDPSAKPSYSAVMENGNIAPGGTLIVNGSSLDADQSLSFDGSAAADGRLRIFGGSGGDALTGGAGDDVIEGGAGGDALTSGLGRDVFIYRNLGDSSGVACDRITDFHFAHDRIDLSLIDADVAADGDQAFRFIGSEGFSGKAGELRVIFDGGQNAWALQGDVNGDGVIDFQLYVSTGAGPPPEADIIL
jgi:Ca2+-binding RTX toxin-like protein